MSGKGIPYKDAMGIVGREIKYHFAIGKPWAEDVAAALGDARRGLENMPNPYKSRFASLLAESAKNVNIEGIRQAKSDIYKTLKTLRISISS